jgi:hypothetical protein
MFSDTEPQDSGSFAVEGGSETEPGGLLQILRQGVGLALRQIARLLALLFFGAALGLWLTYFTIVYILDTLGYGSVSPDEILNDLLFGILSALIALILLIWSRQERS